MMRFMGHFSQKAVCIALGLSLLMTGFSAAGAKRLTASTSRVYRHHALKGSARTVAVPAQTVLDVTLARPLNSKVAKIGDTVTATVKKPVYVGPYLVIPEDTNLLGQIADLNRKAQKKGPNPYIVVNFSSMKRPEDHYVIPIQASLIAYKTGLQKEDYLWRLPEKNDHLKSHVGSAVEGAAVGFFVNPVFGPIIGAGAGLLKSVTVNKIAQHGAVKIKSGQEIPISVQDSFVVPIATAQAR